MFTFLNKSKNETHLGWLGVDMHSHLLHGIDDGSPNVETSVTYLSRLEALGLRRFYTTPHIYQELYPNTAETIHSALEHLREAVQMDIQLDAAAEYMVDETFGSRFG